MNKYIDLTMQRLPELPPHVLISAVFEQIHRSLVLMETSQVGVSFPSVTNTYIGNKIRLHGSETDLNQFVTLGLLDQFDGYVEQTEVLDVPANVSHRQILRKRQQKAASLSEIKRYMRRHGVTKEEAEERFKPQAYKTQTPLPFLWVESQSSGGILFKLFVDQQTEMSEPVDGKFNAYGLSDSATVPWF